MHNVLWGMARALLALPPGLAILCGLASCDGGSDRTPRERTIVLASPLGEEFTAAAQAIAARYASEHPGVAVQVLHHRPRDYDAWLEAQLAAGRGPDLFFRHTTGSRGGSDLAIELDGYLDQINPYSGTAWRQEFSPGILGRHQAESHRIHMIPGDLRAYGFYYNPLLFELAGVEPPRTWAQLLAVCRRLEASGHIPLACSGQNDRTDFAWFILGLRGLQDMLLRHLQDEVARYRRDPRWKMDLTDPWNDSALPITTEDIMLAYIRGPFNPLENPDWGTCCRLLKELVPSYPPGFGGLSFNEAKDLFVSKTAAMIYADTTLAHELAFHRDQVEGSTQAFEAGIFPFPALTRETVDVAHLAPPRGQVEVGQRWHAARTTPARQDQAVDFLRFLLTAENIEYVQSRQTSPNLPPTRQARAPAAVSDHRGILLDHGVSTMTWVSATFDDPEAESTFITNMQLYLLDGLDLEELMARTDAEIVPLLRRRVRDQAVDVDWVKRQLQEAGEPVPPWLAEMH